MSKEVATKTDKPLAEAQNMGDWGNRPEITSSDIRLPILLFQQSMSKAVKAKKAVEGDFLDSNTERVLGSIEKPLEFVPIHLQIMWHIFHFDKKSKKWLWASKHPLVTNPTSPDYNDKWKYEDLAMVDGVETQIKRERRMEFFVLIPKGDSKLPYQLTFKVTSIRAGKQLATQMYVENEAAGLIPPARAFWLAGHLDSNDKGSFAVLDVKPSRNSTAEEIAMATKWYKLILAGQVRTAEVDEAEDLNTTSGEASEMTEPANF